MANNNNQVVGVDFSEALHQLKSGECVRRAGWNGKGMWLYLQDGSHKSHFAMGQEMAKRMDNRDIDVAPCIVMFTAGRKLQPGWLASQADMLAEDWEVLSDE